MNNRGPRLPLDQDGYHRLATLMTRDDGLVIFRRYDFANVMSLLSLQAEVQELEAGYQDQCRRDKAEGKAFSFSFKNIREDSGNEQYKKLELLRETVTRYNDLVLQVSRLNALGPADDSQLDALRGWLRDPEGGAHGRGGRTFLQKSEARLWEQEEGSTFVRVGPVRGERDTFTKFISWILISVIHRYLGFWRIAGRPIDAEAGMYSYSDSHLLRTGTLIATVLSSTIPVLSIFVLYIVKNTYGRIGIAAGFTAVFSAMLAAFSSARRVEIFAATATFAAVEVVFIGSALSTSS